jgi:hypothetical protein
MKVAKGFAAHVVFLAVLFIFPASVSTKNYDTESDLERNNRAVRSIMKIVVPSFKDVRPYGIIAAADFYADGSKFDYLLLASGKNKPMKSDIANFDLMCSAHFTREDAVTFANGLENVLESWNSPPNETDAYYYDFTAYKKKSSADLLIKPESRTATFRFSCSVSKVKRSAYMEWGFCKDGKRKYIYIFKTPAEINELKAQIEEGYFLLTNKTGWKK